MTPAELAAIRARVDATEPGSAVGYNALCRDHSEMSEEALREAFAWLQASHRGLDIIRADVSALLAEVDLIRGIAASRETAATQRGQEVERQKAEVERLRAEAARLWEYLHCDDAKNPDGGKRNPYIQEG